MRRAAVAAIAAAVISAGNPAFAQLSGAASANDHKPLRIEADKGIEWRQSDRVYIARGNAHASRGDLSVYADTLSAYYRPKDRARQPQDSAQGGSTEIFRVVADGSVRIATPTQTVYGDHAVYDLDSAAVVVTGRNLRLVTPKDMITARDSLEWHDREQVAVARGNALAIRDDKRLHADVLTAHVERPASGPSRISRIDALGSVLVSTPQEIARGAAGVYDVETGIITLTGGVTLTRGDDELRGDQAVVDLNRNVSRLLAGPASGGRVQGLAVPRQKAAR